jgi:isoleucyl-tRNA synthetase
VSVEEGASGELEVAVEKAPGGKCERCWNYSAYVGKSREYPGFCARCESVIKAIVP